MRKAHAPSRKLAIPTIEEVTRLSMGELKERFRKAGFVLLEGSRPAKARKVRGR
jgi:hypothetical protein